MNRFYNFLFLIAVVLSITATLVIISDSADANETYAVNDSDSLSTAIQNASPGDTILFSGTFELTDPVELRAGVKIVAGTLTDKQSLIVATTIDDGVEKVVGCYDEMKDFDHSNTNLSDVIEKLDNITLTMASNSYVVNGQAHTIIPIDLTIYGNGATLIQSLSNKIGEADIGISYSGCQEVSSDITYNINNLRNVKIWGNLYTDHTWTVNLEDCDSSSDPEVGNNGFVMIRGDTGNGLVKLNISGCDITSAQAGNDSGVHTDRYVIASIRDCTFTGIPIAINIKPKPSGDSSVIIENCSFTDCGEGNDDQKSYSAPIRIAAGKDNKSMSVGISGCSFSYYSVKSCNGDILIGDGRSGEVSRDVTVSISNTDAEVQYQSPGYYNADNRVADPSLMTQYAVTEDEELKSVGDNVTIEVVESEKPYIPPTYDDDDYFIPPSVTTTEGEDDTTTIVACVAAAVAIAILSVFLIVDKKK